MSGIAAPSRRPIQRAARACRPGFIGRFGRARGGATAVEFAMIALPFLVLVFGIIELAMIFLVSTTMESSAQEVSRTVRTGQFQQSGAVSATDYKNALCAGLGWLQTDCQANVYVDVRTFPTFAAVTATAPITNGAIDPAQMQFNPGTSCSIELARAFYNWKLLAPTLSGVAHMNGNYVLLTSAAAFRNEPYSGQSC